VALTPELREDARSALSLKGSRSWPLLPQPTGRTRDVHKVVLCIDQVARTPEALQAIKAENQYKSNNEHYVQVAYMQHISSNRQNTVFRQKQST